MKGKLGQAISENGWLAFYLLGSVEFARQTFLQFTAHPRTIYRLIAGVMSVMGLAFGIIMVRKEFRARGARE